MNNKNQTNDNKTINRRNAPKDMSKIVEQFQESEEGPHVLLQSLENSASGANLTRASHVLRQEIEGPWW